MRQQQRKNSTLHQQTQKQPAAGAAIFLLNTVRSAGSSSEPENRITISPAAQWIVLSLERDYEPDYRATLSGARGQAVWRHEHLIPATPTSLGIVLPSSLLQGRKL